jgi:hypothetical protein
LNKFSCEIIISPDASQHLSQVITGFMMLKKQNLIDLTVSLSNDSLTSMVEVLVNGKVRLAYDMSDGYHFDLERVQKFFKRIDHIFKRSYNANNHSSYEFAQKVHPLGLNYHVTTKDNIMDKTKSNNVIGKVKWYMKEKSGKNYHQQFYVKKFEDVPRKDNLEPKILFSARTWGPSDSPELNEEETIEMNEMRATCIRKLRNRFGENFVGGFPPRKEAVELYSDCLLDSSVTNRDKFLKIMKQSDICISTIGLHKSNGWKLGEYVASSKAIIGEKFYYDVPNFNKGVNYLEFITPEECVEQVEKLVNDKERLFQMKEDNFHFYNNYLRPDKLVLNSLMGIENIIL